MNIPNGNRVNRRDNSITPIIISCVICLILYNTGWLNSIENSLHDKESYLTRKKHDTDIVIIEIDHASLQELEKWPWPRRYYADVITRLLQDKAKAVFVDIDFSATSNSEDDEIMAQALKQTPKGSVLMPAFKQYSTSGNNKYLTLSLPNKIIREYVTTVSVNLQPDSDGLVRSIKLRSEFAGIQLPTAATIFSGYDADLDEQLRLDLRVTPDSFNRISFYKILNNDYDKSFVQDKFVVIGATALELSDQISVPVYQSLAGPVVQALAYQSLINGKITAIDKTIISIIIVLACIPLWVLFSTRGWRIALIFLLIINSAILAISIFLHVNNVLLLDAVPLLLLATFSFAFTQLAKIDRQLHKILIQRIALYKNEALITHVIKNTSEGLIILDKNLVVTKTNPSAKIIFGNTDDELINSSVKTLFPYLDDAEIKNIKQNRFETMATNSQNILIPVEVSSNQLDIDNERVYTLFLHDISERKARQDVLLYDATHDSLTDLHNRAFLLRNIDEAIHQYVTDKQPATLFMIDLNNFKEINDTLSHNTGDLILIKLGQKLKSLENEATCVARLGGDEFSILTRNKLSDDELSSYIKHILYLISKPIELSDMSLVIDAAIGVALIPEHATTTDDVLIAADVAMYKSKYHKSSYSIYDPQYNYHAKRNLAISNDLKQALKNEQFTLYYQPKIDFKSTMVASLEALIRWQHPTLGLISPDEFIPILENSSLIKPVTMYTVETAIIKQKELQQAGLDISIAVNISAKLFTDQNLADDITQLLSLHGVSEKCIKLEVTESAAISNQERALELLNKLVDNGFELSIDDFGTSYASFSYLKNLPAKELKIDKLFISNICNDDSDKIITATIISLAHGLNMQVVAEGIETKETYEYLDSLGCDFAQGYWISKPVPDESIIPWILNWQINKVAHL